jgi:RNA polymerase sigma-70 factor (ECF subfamily)
MGKAPSTRPSLLVRMRDAADRQAWLQFVEIYAPLVYRFARRRGLQDADAADLTQEVLQAVAGAVQRLDYDPQRGSFRSWLFTVARNKLQNFLISRRRYHARNGVPGALDYLDDLPAPPSDEAALWEQEYQQRLFDWAADEVRGNFHDSTWQAFWQTAVEGKSVKDVARALSLSPGAVYIARSRVLARLREQIQQVQDE